MTEREKFTKSIVTSSYLLFQCPNPKIFSLLSWMTKTFKKLQTVIVLFLLKNDVIIANNSLYKVFLSYHQTSESWSRQAGLWSDASLQIFGIIRYQVITQASWANMSFLPTFCLCHVTWFLGVGSHICCHLEPSACKVAQYRFKTSQTGTRGDDVTCCLTTLT